MMRLIQCLNNDGSIVPDVLVGTTTDDDGASEDGRPAVVGSKENSKINSETFYMLLGRHGSDSLCRDERENKMAAT